MADLTRAGRRQRPKYASAPITPAFPGKLTSFLARFGLLEPDVRHLSVLLFAVSVAGCSTFSYEPAGEQEFQQISSGGCRNRDGDFIIRGFVSNADDDTVVLNDPDDPRSTISLSLPGRGPLQPVKGVFGRNKHEATATQLNELREDRIPVVVTLRCQGDGTPIARSLSYVDEDGDRRSISY